MNERSLKLPENLERAGFVLAAGMLLRTGDACAIEEAVVPEGVTGLANGCFAGCRELVRASLPATLREVGVGAFQDCVMLREVFLPAGMTRLRKATFSGCRALEHLEIPAGVASIGEWAFRGCENLRSVTVPESVQELCAEVFLACPKLTLLAGEGSAGAAHARQFGIPLQILE